jgi:hypothetical protein
MKPLPKQLHRNGCFYQQVQQTSTVAIYSLRCEDGGAIIGFDVFKVRQIGERVFKGKTIPPYEQFPPDSAFGSYAWSYTTEKAGTEKFCELTRATK